MSLDRAKVLLYAKASQQAYQEDGGSLEGWVTVDVADPIPAGDGFQASTYYNPETGEVIIAYRGTEDKADIENDAAIAISMKPAQLEHATVYYEQVQAILMANGIPVTNLTFTGHSLGGGIAQAMGALHSQEAYTFNAPGMQGPIESMDERHSQIYANMDNIHNIRSTLDPVSLWGEQVGDVYTTNAPTGHGIEGFITYLETHPLVTQEIPQVLWNLSRDLIFSEVPVVRGVNGFDIIVDKAYMLEAFSKQFYEQFKALILPNYDQNLFNPATALQDFIHNNPEEFDAFSDLALSRAYLNLELVKQASQGLYTMDVVEAFAELGLYINRDPLALDLDGDGIETLGLSGQDSVHFDHDGEGSKTGTGWLKGDDGFLVRDLNQNGQIDSGQELFGADTMLRNGEKAQHGFAALADLDSNQDGYFDQHDETYQSVKIWQDKNQDGISQEDELGSLEAWGIQSINLGSQSTDITQGNGNKITEKGTFTWSDGTQGEAVNLDLIQAPYYQEQQGGHANSALYDFNLSGSGYVLNLAQATYFSPALEDQAKALMDSKTPETVGPLLSDFVRLWAETATTPSSLDSLTTAGYHIVFYPHDMAVDWDRYLPILGASPEEQRQLIDALSPEDTEAVESLLEYQAKLIDKIAILEAFNGQSLLTFEEGSLRFGGYQLPQILPDHLGGVTTYQVFPINLHLESAIFNAYEAIEKQVESQIISVNRLQPYLESINLTQNGLGEFNLDFSGLDALLAQQSTSDYFKDLALLIKSGGERLAHSGWDGWAILQGHAETLQNDIGLKTMLENGGFRFGDSSSGDMTEQGKHYIGTVENNTFFGSEGNDVFYGGQGNDQLYGGKGGNVYLIQPDWGKDTLYLSPDQSVDRLVFLSDYTADDLSFSRVGSDLVIFLTATENQITLPFYFNQINQQANLLEIEFSNGEIWQTEDIVSKALQGSDQGELISGTLMDDLINGLGGNDILYGDSGDDQLIGGEGQDYLMGEEGNDHLSGGQGADYLSGSSGNDSYYYNQGDGQDTLYESSGFDQIIFGETIRPEDLHYERIGHNLMITLGQSDQSLTLNGYFYQDEQGNYPQRIEKLCFNNGDFIDATGINVALAGSLSSNSFPNPTLTLINQIIGNNSLHAVSALSEPNLFETGLTETEKQGLIS